MKVKELMEMLKDVDQEAVVLVNDGEWGERFFVEGTEISFFQAERKPNADYNGYKSYINPGPKDTPGINAIVVL